ncbi:hypothetical protein E3N88_10540 [Mikania micrantha]|uniref:Uncharacterized protein n=1 Tax=Mikania micrantha TaxID=192012 RepID=A0A5N6PC07_9ASTR|nr:hypothetical protein E3N88_10540 [Mikania micrantha]
MVRRFAPNEVRPMLMRQVRQPAPRHLLYTTSSSSSRSSPTGTQQLKKSTTAEDKRLLKRRSEELQALKSKSSDKRKLSSSGKLTDDFVLGNSGLIGQESEYDATECSYDEHIDFSTNSADHAFVGVDGNSGNSGDNWCFVIDDLKGIPDDDLEEMDILIAEIRAWDRNNLIKVTTKICSSETPNKELIVEAMDVVGLKKKKELLKKWHIDENIAKHCKGSFSDADRKKSKGVLEYLTQTWLHSYRDLFVTAWTNRTRNFGQRTTNQVESQHLNLKRYLRSTNSTPASLVDTKIALSEIDIFWTKLKTTKPTLLEEEEIDVIGQIVAHLGVHFINVTLQGDYPMPTVNPIWKRYRNDAASDWEFYVASTLKSQIRRPHRRSSPSFLTTDPSLVADPPSRRRRILPLPLCFPLLLAPPVVVALPTVVGSSRRRRDLLSPSPPPPSFYHHSKVTKRIRSNANAAGDSIADTQRLSRRIGIEQTGSQHEGYEEPHVERDVGSLHMRYEGSHHSHRGFDRLSNYVLSNEEEDSDHEDDGDTTTHPPSATRMMHTHHMIDSRSHLSDRLGRSMFANSKVHRLIRKIFDVSLEGAWPTFKKVPKEALDQMFETFRTTFSWNSDLEFASKQAFENVLRDRYSDIMLEMRMESATYARAAGHFIPKGGYNFIIMSDFPPKLMSQDIWRELCLFWGSEDWGKKSARGRNNRMKGHDSGEMSRHTGGSIGYDEHRFRLEIKLGRPPTFKELFLHTHLKKDSKAKFWAGNYDDSPKGMEFCTQRSKETYEAYSMYMEEKYGEDETQHPVDRNFILTGTPSSSVGSTPSHAAFEQSKQEVRELRSHIVELQSQFDTQKEQMREAMREEIREEREKMKEDMRTEMQLQMAQIMKQMGIHGNHPPT